MIEQTSVITIFKLHRLQGNKCHIPLVVYGVSARWPTTSANLDLLL